METQENFSAKPRQAKIALMALGLVLMAAIVIVAILRERIVNPPQWQVSVAGQGKVSYQPDIAEVNLGVQVDKAAKPEDALNQLNGKVKQIVAAIKAKGVDEADIQTQNYSLYPQYDYVNGVSSVAGYNANQQILIKIKDIANNSNKVNQVIEAAGKAGANQVNGVAFNVANLEDLKQQARVKAISDAKSKASSLAGAAGVKLGKVVGWWENLVQAPGINSISYADGKGGAGMSAGLVSAPNVSSGTLEIILEVNLSYQVK